MRVPIAGESWMSHTTHVKGFDSFTTSTYAEGAGPLREALGAAGHDVTYLPTTSPPPPSPPAPRRCGPSTWSSSPTSASTRC